MKSGITTRYYYDGSLIPAKKDSSNNLQKIYVNDGFGIVAMVRNVD